MNGRLRKHATAYHLQRQNRNNNTNTNSWYRGTNLKSNERNLSRRGNQSANLPYSKVDSTATPIKENSEQTPPLVGTNPQAVRASPTSASIQLEKSVEFGSLGPVVLEDNSSQVCKSYASTVIDEEKAQAPEESFKWSVKVSSIVSSESSSHIGTCQEKVPVQAFSWSTKGTLKVPSESSSDTSTSTSNNQENINLPLMEAPSRCNKENVKVLSEAPPLSSTCKENVKVNAKAWSRIYQSDSKVLPDLHHRSWAEISKR